jgi:hypothetical protein
MGVLLLVRHGQASIDAVDYDHLSALGRRQAQALGVRLAHADLPVERMVCGTSARQRDTARELVAALGFPAAQILTDARLDEFDHVGLLAANPSAGLLRCARRRPGPRCPLRWMRQSHARSRPTRTASPRTTGAIRRVMPPSSPGWSTRYAR